MDACLQYFSSRNDRVETTVYHPQDAETTTWSHNAKHMKCLFLPRADGCAVSDNNQLHMLLKHVRSASKFKISKCGLRYIRDSRCIVQGLSDNVRGVETYTVLKPVQAHDHVNNTFISTTIRRKSSYRASTVSELIHVQSADPLR